VVGGVVVGGEVVGGGGAVVLVVDELVVDELVVDELVVDELVVDELVVVGATVVLVVNAALVYRLNSSIDHHQLESDAVSTTATYWASWLGKLTISGVPVPVQLATKAQAVPLYTSTS